MVQTLQNWLREHESDLLSDYRAMLRIPSVEGPALPNAPFGEHNRAALDLALGMTQGWGWRTRDLDGYCGYAEFGTGDREVAVFGHLDVVPVGPGWKHDPFGAEIDGGYVYARGAIDDKGPTMAALYAARAIAECAPDLAARIRVVFGCDEESGFQCIKRYVQEEKPPTYGVAPDAGWPLIHAEKGIADAFVSFALPGTLLKLVEIKGGQARNIVADACTARLLVDESAKAEIQSRLDQSWDKNLSFSWQGSELHIEAVGKAAHGSWPWGGDNAVIRVLRFLMEIAPLADQETYTELFEMTHINGSGIGAEGSDEPSRDLTCNLGIAKTEGDRIQFTMNIRYPVTWKGADLRARIEKHLKGLPISCELDDFTDSKPLYFPLDHPLTKTICEVYETETGDTKKPGVMGGGTYARAVENTVAIGTGWLGDGDAHQTDERLAIESLYKMSRIYAHILWRLATG